MALFPVYKNYTLKSEQKGRNHWFNRGSKLKEVEIAKQKYPYDREVEKLIREYLGNNGNA